ncbi:MAG: competence protein ComEC [Planctomycetaceae bacterium]|nr:competence protein ComEC [Planctomycetaceae bacterium]
MANVARELIWPTDDNILIRMVFLHVGQGESTIVLVADSGGYRVLLVDINIDKETDGIDVPRLMRDLLEGEDGGLTFVNTHPHSDHLNGVTELADAVAITEVWHSGHAPGKAHADAYKDLQNVIKQVTKAGGTEVELLGSRSAQQIGDAEYYVLSPAEHVVEEIEGESGEERYRRIHEQCAVLKFGTRGRWIMLTGDADRNAWEKHIADYHSDRLRSSVLSAAHHGSRTFFRYDEDDDPYLDALQTIEPDYVVISAPTNDESPHDHPHEDAVGFYADEVGKDNVLHTGEKRHSFICDIFRDGQYQIGSDNGDLADAYPAKDEDEKTENNKAKVVATTTAFGTRVDHRPMGAS